MGIQIGSGKWGEAASPVDMGGLMEMFAGTANPPRRRPAGETKPIPVSQVRGGGFWEWLKRQGMPPEMIAAIRQDPNLQAMYFEQFQASQAANKPQPTPGPGSSTSGGASGWDQEPPRRRPKWPEGHAPYINL